MNFEPLKVTATSYVLFNLGNLYINY